eukprot:363544-Chlamydomonas_euryale.AAC.11
MDQGRKIFTLLCPGVAMLQVGLKERAELATFFPKHRANLSGRPPFPSPLGLVDLRLDVC